MIYVDGAQKSGSGTVVRFVVGLATLADGECEEYTGSQDSGQQKPGENLRYRLIIRISLNKLVIGSR